MSRIKWGNESAQMKQRVGSNAAMSRLNIFPPHGSSLFQKLPISSRTNPEGIPKDCSNKFLQKISLHSSGMPPKLLKTPYHPYPSSLTQSSQLTPKLLRTPSQSSLIILPNPSQLPPNFLPTFSQLSPPKWRARREGQTSGQQQGFCAKSFFSRHKNIFVEKSGGMWRKMCIFDG